MRFSRCSGILLHPTSLPGPLGSGDLGASAYHFIDWLNVAGQSLWQMLPFGPAGMANSPYMCLSAFAGNPLLIDLRELVQNGWLSTDDLEHVPNFQPHTIDFLAVTKFRQELLEKASREFFHQSKIKDINDFNEFCEQESTWLNDYALFQSLNSYYNGELWTSWDEELVQRKSKALVDAEKKFKDEINFHKFTQWCFSRQWKNLHAYAQKNGVKLIGDIPVFVAHHSADVWSRPDEFYLDEDGNPNVVAGVPPDYFSTTGQRWGNPLYRWDVMKDKQYQWWVERFQKMFAMFDFVRIDHFRGFESYWEIPADEETAVKGRWVKGPGEYFFKMVQQKIGELPIIAEDLGIITDEVRVLRERLMYPGMRVLQFAFAAGPENDYLPHQYQSDTVVYTGTHDNDTTRGWYEKATEHEKDFVRRYCQTDGHNIHWDLIRLALHSVADIAIVPFQDVLGLNSDARMNFPGTVGGNWHWRFTWDQVDPYLANRLYEISALSWRCDPNRLKLL